MQHGRIACKYSLLQPALTPVHCIQCKFVHACSCVAACNRSEAGPLLEVELELVTPDMVWKPELGGSAKGSVQALVERWLTSFLEVGWLAIW